MRRVEVALPLHPGLGRVAVSSSAATLAWSEPLTALPRSARSRVSSSRSLWKAAYEDTAPLPQRSLTALDASFSCRRVVLVASKRFRATRLSRVTMIDARRCPFGCPRRDRRVRRHG